MSQQKQAFPEPKRMLQEIATYVLQSQKSTKSLDELLENPQELNKVVLSTRVNWKDISDRIGCSREYLYHWFMETYSRHINMENKITKQQKNQIRIEIMNEIRTGEYQHPNMQMRIKQKVFGVDSNVNRSEFNVIYNNIKRSKAVQNLLSALKVNLTREKHTGKLSDKIQRQVPQIVIPQQQQQPTQYEEQHGAIRQDADMRELFKLFDNHSQDE